MWLLTAAVVVMVGLVWQAFASTPATNPDFRNDYLLGAVITTALGVLALLGAWATYFGHQRSVELHSGSMSVHSWIRWWKFGTDRSIDLSDARSALMIRPGYVEISRLAVADRPSWGPTLRPLPHVIDRIGTFWWLEEEYAELRSALAAQGMEVEYRESVSVHFPIPGR